MTDVQKTLQNHGAVARLSADGCHLEIQSFWGKHGYSQSNLSGLAIDRALKTAGSGLELETFNHQTIFDQPQSMLRLQLWDEPTTALFGNKGYNAALEKFEPLLRNYGIAPGWNLEQRKAAIAHLAELAGAIHTPPNMKDYVPQNHISFTDMHNIPSSQRNDFLQQFAELLRAENIPLVDIRGETIKFPMLEGMDTTGNTLHDMLRQQRGARPAEHVLADLNVKGPAISASKAILPPPAVTPAHSNAQATPIASDLSVTSHIEPVKKTWQQRVTGGSFEEIGGVKKGFKHAGIWIGGAAVLYGAGRLIYPGKDDEGKPLPRKVAQNLAIIGGGLGLSALGARI